MSFLETIEKNRTNFLKFNSIKFERFQQHLSNSNTKKIINAIPLLLCVNEKKVPGYIEGPVPVGISGYEPDAESLRFIESRFHK